MTFLYFSRLDGKQGRQSSGNNAKGQNNNIFRGFHSYLLIHALTSYPIKMEDTTNAYKFQKTIPSNPFVSFLFGGKYDGLLE